MKFSIVIPCYNSSETILQVLDSCKNQTYKCFEVVLVDDCSTDSTVSVIKDYMTNNADIDIRLIELNENSGPSVARNVAINNCHNEYVCLLDSDDFFHVDKLKIINNYICSNKSVDVITHDFTYDDFEHLKLDSFQVKKIKFLSVLLKNHAVTPSLVGRRELLQFDETLNYCEDHHLMMKLAYRYTIYHLNAPLVKVGRVLLTPGGQSSNKLKMRLGEMNSYILLCKNEPLLLPLLPLLLSVSLMKHLLRVVVK